MVCHTFFSVLPVTRESNFKAYLEREVQNQNSLNKSVSCCSLHGLLRRSKSELSYKYTHWYVRSTLFINCQCWRGLCNYSNVYICCVSSRSIRMLLERVVSCATAVGLHLRLGVSEHAGRHVRHCFKSMPQTTTMSPLPRCRCCDRLLQHVH